ncbi:MAG: SufE family protein [Flavobacteriales bacterium]
MSTIAEKEEEIIEAFSMYEDWNDKYEYLIDLAKTLPPFDPRYKTEAHLIHGCQSRVWLHADFDGERVHYFADSEAMIPKGIVGMLVKVLSNERPEDIAKAELDFIKEIGLKEHLSPNRSNGLVAMIRQMKNFAIDQLKELK